VYLTSIYNCDLDASDQEIKTQQRKFHVGAH